ncbi:MAG: hypothetical protein GY920_17360 [Aliivibrio sp.]|nr:hypothetical protein [Aliivibrio sp.]
MQKLTQKQIENTEYVKIVKKLLSQTAHKVTKECTDYNWKLQISTPEFSVKMHFHMYSCPVELMKYGTGTWSFGVWNSKGNRVMYSSSVNPQVAHEIGSMLSRATDVTDKKQAIKDWEELEEWADL